MTNMLKLSEESESSGKNITHKIYEKNTWTLEFVEVDTKYISEISRAALVRLWDETNNQYTHNEFTKYGQRVEVYEFTHTKHEFIHPITVAAKKEGNQ